ILCNPPINTLSFLLNFVIEPAGQKQVLSHKYPYCHSKGAGGVCQVSFFVSIPNKSLLYGYARSLIANF
ncbi:hypothetical protein, partial [Wolbachia pipientis]|uniref:hypothetical protein n=1 Tax=Wolbachia pipientis TaxID=955 RepID=UPI001C9DB654